MSRGVTSVLLAILAQLLHIALVLAAAPTLIGIIDLLRARMLGRSGPHVLHQWRDFARLLRKQPVVAESASDVFATAPLIAFAAIAAAAALVPSFALDMAFAPVADVVVIIGLLALSRTALAMAGMDTGTALGGMGAARTMTIAAFAEPALLLVLFALALNAGSSNLDLIVAMQQESALAGRSSIVFAFAAIALVALMHTARGLLGGQELGMLGQATALESSGRDLALFEAITSLRLLVWLDLIGAMFAPFGMASASAGIVGWVLGLVLWLARLLVLGVVVAWLEAFLGHLQRRHIVRLLGFAAVCGLLAALFLFAGARTA